MKKILLIYTGGTIGMIQKKNSLSPFDFDNLKNAIPEIKDCGSDVQHISLENPIDCLLYTSPSPRDSDSSRMPSSA